MLQVVWFKRDLRVEDHAPLAAALRAGRVLPLYIVEPEYWRLPDTSGRQWAFLRESLIELRADFAARGGALIVRVGDAVDVLADLHARHGIAALHSHEETGNAWTFARDKRVAEFVRERAIPWHETPQFGVVRRLADRDRWSAHFERFMARPIEPAPAQIARPAEIDPGVLPEWTDFASGDDTCPGRQRGGRKAAVELLEGFYAGRGRAYAFEMSSPATAARSCSRLSAHLAAGTISMRETIRRAYAERAALAQMLREARAVDLRSADALIARLHWHCHFIQKLESEPAIEFRAMHPAHAARTHAHNEVAFRAWRDGRTGFPFVDACIRMLAATGWINFRMRAMLTAFASYHLDLDWRATGAVLARRFVDYEPGIHWPQIQMQSGLTGINAPRIYNPAKQSTDQDPDGAFIRRWVPELADSPTAALHAPWLYFDGAPPNGYPARIVDHEAAARAARERLSAIRREAGYGDAAQRVYRKHGSRKRPIHNDDPGRRKRPPRDTRQLGFDLEN